MQPKRIVLLTRDKQEHRYVANVLSAAATIERIVVDCRSEQPSIERVLALGPRKFLGKAARALLLKALGDEKARQRALRALFSSRGDTFDLSDRVLRVYGINGPDTQRILDEIRPNLILVYGMNWDADFNGSFPTAYPCSLRHSSTIFRAGATGLRESNFA
jgi:hypothetical protein